MMMGMLKAFSSFGTVLHIIYFIIIIVQYICFNWYASVKDNILFYLHDYFIDTARYMCIVANLAFFLFPEIQ